VGIRYLLIRYELDGASYVGSGFLVTDRAVLTADHVADGTGHRIVHDGVELAVEGCVRSGDTTVDLAVLILRHPVPDLAPIPCALVDRGGGGKLTGCWAIGFPRRSKDDAGRASRQVYGSIRPADGVHADGKADGAWLTLVGEKADWGDAPADEAATGDGGNPWGGMSGAAVVKGNMVIGVVSRYYAEKGPETLTVTPLTALKLLPDGTKEQFRVALGLGNLGELQVLTGDGKVARPTPAPAGRADASLVAFSAGIRDRYRAVVEAAGLPVPDLWDEASLGSLRRAHHGRDATADALEALCLGIQALPVLREIGGTNLSLRKLQHLYRRHVGRWPATASREDLLVHAAAASIVERRQAADQGYMAEPLTALARFMLAVAGSSLAAASLDDTSLRGLADWLTGPLTQQREDAEEYLAAVSGGRTWALIELVAEESAGRARPTGVVVDLIPEHGQPETRRIPCEPGSGETAEEIAQRALREAVATLPDGDVLVDLCLPRRWLDAGVERWDVVQVGGRYESMSRHYRPQLRWAMHRHDHKLRGRLVKRFKAVDWTAEPEAIPLAVTSDPEQLQGWLDGRDTDGARVPPYLAGVEPVTEAHDALGTLLWEGYGFAVWFGPDTAAATCADAVCLAASVAVPQRRDELPAELARNVKLRAYRPVIVWSDPEGRADFQLPNPRGGTRRGGTMREH
jgi:hypothetical protein